MNASAPLLGKQYACPQCHKVATATPSKPPAFLYCESCGRRFLCHVSAARRLALVVLLVSALLIAADTSIAIVVLHFGLFSKLILYIVVGAVAAGAIVLTAGGVKVLIAVRESRIHTLPLSAEFTASKEGDLALLQEAFKHGAAVNGKSSDGTTCLQYAAQFGHEAVVAELLTRGADPNIPSQRSYPILEAATNGHVGVVRLLLSHGARSGQEMAIKEPTPTRPAGVRVNAITLAALRGHADVIKCLIDAGLDPN